MGQTVNEAQTPQALGTMGILEGFLEEVPVVGPEGGRTGCRMGLGLRWAWRALGGRDQLPHSWEVPGVTPPLSVPRGKRAHLHTPFTGGETEAQPPSRMP